MKTIDRASIGCDRLFVVDGEDFEITLSLHAWDQAHVRNISKEKVFRMIQVAGEEIMALPASTLKEKRIAIISGRGGRATSVIIAVRLIDYVYSIVVSTVIDTETSYPSSKQPKIYI